MIFYSIFLAALLFSRSSNTLSSSSTLINTNTNTNTNQCLVPDNTVTPPDCVPLMVTVADNEFKTIRDTTNEITTSVYKMTNNEYYNTQRILEFIKKINHANHIINDMCEMMEEKVGFISGSDKPNCRYNASFIVNSSLQLFHVEESVRTFFLTRKKAACKKSTMECGELSIILKLVDLINSLVHISSKITTISELFINIEVTSFDELFQTYIESLENTEILANITLHKDRANFILERERQRIRRETSRTKVDDFLESANVYFGSPIKVCFCYIGTTIGNAFGSVIDGATDSLAMSKENKFIMVFILVIVILKK